MKVADAEGSACILVDTFFTRIVMMVLRDLEVQYCEVRKLTLSVFVCRKMFSFTKEKSMYRARFK